VDVENSVNYSIFRTREEFPKYVNSATQIQLQVTDSTKANIEQRYDNMTSNPVASKTIPNVIEI